MRNVVAAARRQVVPPSEWLNIFNKEFNKRPNGQTDEQNDIAFAFAFAKEGLIN